MPPPLRVQEAGDARRPGRDPCIPGKSQPGCNHRASLNYGPPGLQLPHYPNRRVFISDAPPPAELLLLCINDQVGTPGFLSNTDHPAASATTSNGRGSSSAPPLAKPMSAGGWGSWPPGNRPSVYPGAARSRERPGLPPSLALCGFTLRPELRPSPTFNPGLKLLSTVPPHGSSAHAWWPLVTLNSPSPRAARPIAPSLTAWPARHSWLWSFCPQLYPGWGQALVCCHAPP